MSLFQIIHFKRIADERGALVALEQHKTVPFEIKRVYYCTGLNPKFERGFHAHHQIQQLAVCVTGSCVMVFDDGVTREEFRMDSQDKGVLIPPMMWHEMKDFSQDCVFLVLASDVYDEADYIRDYPTFVQLSTQLRKSDVYSPAK
ncbi:sugar 3,4-ketoisomerase [Rheinheimera marina]|uniref:Sugar 3,4-ketoisomerase n=1 Tax=Rheinheimera marina TaxID=1774958 RepID=A0ABV9JRQ5_9GAMM